MRPGLANGRQAPRLAVTGATGQLGGLIAHRLAARGVEHRLVVRDRGRAPVLPGAVAVEGEYADAPAFRAALEGADTLLFVSAHETRDRVRLHTTAVDAAVEAGVERVVYVSFLAAAPQATFTFARDHWFTEQRIREVGLRHVFLRNSIYLDMLPLLVGHDGAIRGPAGEARFAPVARADIADVAVAALLDPTLDGHTYDVTGPEALTMREVAAGLAGASGRPISYHPETLDEAYAARASSGPSRGR